jgi:hypothetical protein
MKSILDWFDKNSTFITLVIIILYIGLRLTGYFTPVDYKLNYIASHADTKTTEIYIFLRAITGFLAIIAFSILLFKIR